MNRINALRTAVASLILAVGTSAMAALPAGAEAAITTYQADVVTAIGLVIAAGIAIYAVKKLGQKMGWL
ncbi:hypothetical protein D3C71_1875690 [compost metagenome]